MSEKNGPFFTLANRIAGILRFRTCPTRQPILVVPFIFITIFGINWENLKIVYLLILKYKKTIPIHNLYQLDPFKNH